MPNQKWLQSLYPQKLGREFYNEKEEVKKLLIGYVLSLVSSLWFINLSFDFITQRYSQA